MSLESDITTSGRSQQLAVQFVVSHEKSLLLAALSSEDVMNWVGIVCAVVICRMCKLVNVI
jgi:hypothetical protein